MRGRVRTPKAFAKRKKRSNAFRTKNFHAGDCDLTVPQVRSLVGCGLSFKLTDAKAAAQVFGDGSLVRVLEANGAVLNGSGDVDGLQHATIAFGNSRP
jgi:hypothetical protein